MELVFARKLQEGVVEVFLEEYSLAKSDTT